MNRAPLPPNPRRMRGRTAGHQAFGLKHIHSFSRPRLYKLFSALVYLHMLSFQIKPSQGGPGRYAAFGGLIMPRGRLGEAFGDASADGTLLDLYGLRVCRPAAKRHRQNCFLVDWQHSKRPPLPPPSFYIDWTVCGELEKIRRERGEEIRETKGRRRKREKYT